MPQPAATAQARSVLLNNQNPASVIPGTLGLSETAPKEELEEGEVVDSEEEESADANVSTADTEKHGGEKALEEGEVTESEGGDAGGSRGLESVELAVCEGEGEAAVSGRTCSPLGIDNALVTSRPHRRRHVCVCLLPASRCCKCELAECTSSWHVTSHPTPRTRIAESSASHLPRCPPSRTHADGSVGGCLSVHVAVFAVCRDVRALT